MKRKAQRFLSLFMAVLMTLSMVSTPVNAAPVQNPLVELTVEDENVETKEVVNTEETEEAEEPVDTEETEEAEEPVNTEETEEAEEPVDTEETEEPVDTEETEEAEEPVDTEEAEEVEEPVDTEETEEEKPAENVSNIRTEVNVEDIKSMFKFQKFDWNGKGQKYDINGQTYDVSGISAYSVALEEEVTVDENDTAVMALAAELYDVEVEDEDGKKLALTEEQIQQILYMYQQYLNQWKDNANILGVQMPFFLNYNDKGEDGLGILGEMLVLAGHTVDQVRSGEYKFDDLMGMIQNFYYADKFALEFYGDGEGANRIISKKRDEVLKKVEDSGATTLAQKMLVINDWLAHEAIFDMPYIMKGDTDGDGEKDDPIMVAEIPKEHEHYDEIYDEMYALYTKQIGDQFRQNIAAGVEAELRQQYYEGAIQSIIVNTYKDKVHQGVVDDCINNQEMSQEEAEAAADAYMEKNADEINAAANEEANKFMEDNAEAIKNDAAGFVKDKFGEKAAAELSAGADAFIESAKTEGVEVQPGVVMTIDQIVDAQMDQPLDDLGGMTPNEAIPDYAKQAAIGLTNGILGAWEGNHVGILAEGKGVCAGYAKAFAYLLQYMSPEIYGKNDTADMSKSENWKTAEELYYTDGNLDVNQNYLVDMVRITFDAQTSMFGEESPFGEVHFWNAVKVDGKWYYVDPCYTDIYVECMSRDRVEIDGTMNHMYFLFSHDTALEMYDGNMAENGIAGLYSDAAKDQSYEDSWFARIATNTYFHGSDDSDDRYAYYMYDSTDQLAMMREFNEMQDSKDFNAEDFKALMEGSDPTYSIVRHDITKPDTADNGESTDTDFETLIEFNYKANKDDDTSVARVRGTSGAMEENDLLTKLFAQYKEECEIYPSIKMTCALYGGKIYFNLSNCILSYDLKECKIETVKVYNTVSAKRNKTNPFGGMAFEVCSEEDVDFTFTNHPIAAMTIKDDEKMYVSIATNLGFISGKDSVSDTGNDTGNYGYAFEESNYNPDYSTYMQGTDIDDGTLEEMGFSKETNDNDEFMWSAVFVEKINMSEPCGHTYEKVTVEPFCGRDGYTENRCSKCGAVDADSTPEVDEGSALAHHYVHFDEQYYTKDKNGNWNKGDCYVCTVCGFAVSEPKEPTKNNQESDEDYQERVEEYEKEKAIYDNAVETAGHTYVPTDAVWDDVVSVTFTSLICSSVCPDRQKNLDCLLEDNTITVELSDKVTNEDVKLVGYEGDCETGATAIYSVSGTVKQGGKDYAYTATKKVALEAGKHAYKGTFTWTEVDTEEKWKATADLKCVICGNEQKDVEAVVVKDDENSVAPKCEEAGKDVFVATATAVDEEGKEIGSSSEQQTVELPATGHDYVEGICTVCGKEKPYIVRLSGKTRVHTSILSADELKSVMNVEQFDSIIVASGTGFADALAGSYLAKVKNAPILLDDGSNTAISLISEYVKDNLKESGTVYILGGSAAVSAELENSLGDVNVERLSGKSRYETNLEILKEAGVTEGEILICTGAHYADSLSSSAAGRPILLINNSSKKLTDAQKEYLNGISKVKFTIIGGTEAVSEKFEQELKQMGEVDRLSGKTRYETSVKVAEKYFEEPETVLFAYAENFPDGLSGGSLGVALNAPMILTKTGKEDVAKTYVEGTSARKGIVLGGTKLISDDAMQNIFGGDAQIDTKK